MIEQVIQWLRDGNETNAANMLSECTLEFQFIDIYSDFGGGGEIYLHDAKIAAPRKFFDQLDQDFEQEKTQVETAVRELVQEHDWYIRNIAWTPRGILQRSEIEKDIREYLQTIDSEHIQRAWDKVLQRKTDDPEGAITAARTLLETVCKHILDEKKVAYSSNIDLSKLYYLTAEQLNLAPEQHTEKLIRGILGNCQSIISGIATLRNRLGDAHGKGIGAIVPDAALAELAVNLAGSLAKYFLVVWESSQYKVSA